MRNVAVLASLLALVVVSAQAQGGKGKGGGHTRTTVPHVAALRMRANAVAPSLPHANLRSWNLGGSPGALSQFQANSGISSAAAPFSGGTTTGAFSPAMLYGAMLPFGQSGASMALAHGYHAHRSYYGHGRGGRGYGHGYGRRNANGITSRTRHLAKLVHDLNVLTTGYVASPAERNILRGDLMSVAQGGIRPPSAGVSQLAGNLVDYLPKRKMAPLNTERLALDLETVMNGARLGAQPVNQAITSAHSVLRASGVPQAGIQAIQANLQAVGFLKAAGNNAVVVR